MTDIRFYHLERSPLEVALPQLLQKIYQRDMHSVVLAGSQDRVSQLDTMLWTFDPNSFLPHGAAPKDKALADQQPIWLTRDADDNPNAAQVMVALDGAEPAEIDKYDIICIIFDGRDQAAVQHARGRWKIYKDQGHDISYWQQTDGAGWQKKA